MKHKKMMIAFVISVFASASDVNACSIGNAYVTDLYQYTDGTMFAVFDHTTDCTCSIPTRLAYSKADGDFFTPVLITAMAAHMKIAAGGTADCPIHGNTARMIELHLMPN